MSDIDQGDRRFAMTKSIPRRPSWATETYEYPAETRHSTRRSLEHKMFVPREGYDPIEIYQSIEATYDDSSTYRHSEPLADIVEMGIGDPEICEQIAATLRSGSNEGLDHLLIWTTRPTEEFTENMRKPLADALDECARVLREITPDRAAAYPEVWA